MCTNRSSSFTLTALCKCSLLMGSPEESRWKAVIQNIMKGDSFQLYSSCGLERKFMFTSKEALGNFAECLLHDTLHSSSTEKRPCFHILREEHLDCPKGLGRFQVIKVLLCGYYFDIRKINLSDFLRLHKRLLRARESSTIITMGWFYLPGSH